MTSNAGKPRGILHPQKGEQFFHLQRYSPSDDLRFFVEHYWSVQWNVPAPQTQEILPHPSVHLVIEQGNSGILGVVTGKFTRVLQGSGWVFGIKFNPGAFYPFAKFPISEMTDRRLHLSDIFHSDGTAYEEEMLSLNDEGKKVECAERFLRAHLPLKDETMELIQQIVGRIMTDKGILNVGQIASAFSLTARTLQRLFNQYVGVGPKWIIKRYRMHEAVEQMNEGGVVNWVQLALDLGYYDQAHFIKDFRTLIGKSPGEYVKSAAEFRR
ncbi:MAG: AraC family transcriptional regulator [Ignavibacteriales bacterium]|nr:AraC family transcriptional regulator [Ignavibacteriales bacterium]